MLYRHVFDRISTEYTDSGKKQKLHGGDMGVYGIEVLGFFSYGNSVISILRSVLRYHLALRYAVFHHFG